MLEDIFSLKSILKTAAAKNDNKAEDGEKLDNALPPTETTPPTDIVQQPANQLQVQTPTDLAVPATTETAPIAPQQPPAGKKSISIKEEKSYSGGLWNTLVLNIPDMTAQVSKSLRDLALRRISALTAQNRGRPPSWAVFKNEVAPWKLWNDIQYKTKTYTITTTENEFFRAAVEKLRQTNFDVSALEPYAQGTAAEQTEQQTDKGPISYSIEIVRNPKDQKFARWDYLLLRVKQSNRKIPDLALLESFKEEIKKNFSIDANNPPGTVVWNSAESAYVLFRVLPSKIQQLAEGLKVKNFKVDQLLEAMRAYKTQLEESNEQLTDPRKTLQVENVSANTKFLFAIRFPAARDLQTELSEYIKFSFPSKGNLTDLQRVPVAEGQAAQPDANKPNGMRLEKDYRWYLHGSFDDIYKFSALIKKLGWNVDSLRLVLGNLLTSGALERTRYTGALDGYELMETDAATGVTKQKRDKKNNPMFRYEDFYEDIDKTVKKGISVYDGQKDGIRWLYERNCCILGDKTGTGKCTAADTLIFANGQLMTMKEIWDNYASENITPLDEGEEWCEPSKNLFINSFDGEKITTARVGGLFRQKFVGKLRKIKTSNGKTITTTYQHKFLKPTGWSNDLTVGDCIIAPRFLPIQSNEYTDCSDDLAEFLGWQISEGNELGGKHGFRVTITQSDVAVLQNLRNLFRKIAFDNNIIRKNNNFIEPKIYESKNSRASNLVLHGEAYKSFLESKGYIFGKKSKDKQIPTYILHAKDSAAKLFLRSYFSAEAYCAIKSRRIDLCSASKKLIWQISYMLGRFGIQHSFGESEKYATNGTKIKRNYYRLYIIGSGVAKFINDIGFIQDYKNQAFLKQTQKINPNKEGKPLNHILEPFFAQNDIPPLHANIRDHKYVDGQKWASNQEINKFIEGFNKINSGESFKDYQSLKNSRWTTKTSLAYTSLTQESIEKVIMQLQQMKNSDLQYEKIVSIEEIEYENYIYDLTIFGNKNYVAEGLVCHNTLETLAAAKMRLAQDGGKCLIFTLKSTQTQLSWALTKLLGEDPASVVVCAPRFDELTEAGYIVDSTLSEESMANAKWVVLSYSNLQATPNYDPITKQMILDQNGVPTFKARDRKKKVIMESLLKTQFTCVIMDESHTLKSGATGKGDLIAMLTPKIPFRWAASATAVANTPKDLHPILQLIGHTLGEMSSRDFNKEFVGEKMTIKDAKEDGFEQKLKETEERASKLRKWLLLSGAYISRSQKSIRPDLPSHKKRALFLEEEGFDMQAFFNDVREKIATYGNKAAAVVSLTAQRVKLADMKVPKSIAAAKKLIDKGHKVLLFSNFVRPCRIMYNELNAYLKTLDPDFYAVSIMQGDHVENIDKSIADFKNADSAARVMIISAKKGGTGISLENSCSYVIMNDYDWSPSTAEQTEGRAFRITNDIPVRTLYMVIRGKDGKLNPDEVFFNLVQGKIKIANKIQDLGAEAEETHMAGLNDAPIRAKMIKAREEEIDIERRYREQWNEMAHQYGADDVAFDDKDDEVDMGDEMSEAAQEFEDNGIDLDAQGESLTKDDQAFLNLGNEEDDEDSDRAKNASWYGIVKSITPV